MYYYVYIQECNKYCCFFNKNLQYKYYTFDGFISNLKEHSKYHRKISKKFLKISNDNNYRGDGIWFFRLPYICIQLRYLHDPKQ